jgi:hypothetical protein
MEMPKACWSCGLSFVCKAANDFLTTKEAGCSVLKVGMEGCLILCQLPEGHGRLVDADEFLKRAIGTKCFDEDDSRMLTELVGESITIVPAERSET